jgi:hypothetical protein
VPFGAALPWRTHENASGSIFRQLDERLNQGG